MDEAAYLTDCSTLSHASVSTFEGKHEFVPRHILFILKKKNRNLVAKAKPLQDLFNCTTKVISKENVRASDIPDFTLVVVDDFEGLLFQHLKKKLATSYVTVQVRGPPAFIDACDKLSLETYKRPLFSKTLTSMVFWISGFESRKGLKVKVGNLIKSMGGSVVKNSGTRVNHIICDSPMAEGYQYGTTFKLPVLSVQWVFDCWDKRHDLGFKPGDLNIVDYKIKVFSNLSICFVGFDSSENIHIQRLKENEGQLVDLNHPECTHIVVNDIIQNATYDFDKVKPPVFIVRSAWFWASIAEDTKADEEAFLFTNQTESRVPCQRISQNCCVPSAPSLKLASSSPTIFEESDLLNNNESSSRNLLANEPSNKKTHTLMELVQTEENYVNILNTIMKIQERTVDPSYPGGALLSEGEARIIFGNIAGIHQVHLLILHDLIRCAENWNDAETLIGPIFSSRAEKLLKCYTPFIRYYDVSNNILSDCEKKNPRFHAYLRYCQDNDCGRQNMKDLLIRPVQRLASTSLLLKDLLKATDQNHPDYAKLEEALRNIEQVMRTINNDRKDIADRSAIFDVFNLIENCPPVLVSAERTFLLQFEAQEVSDAHAALSKRGDFLVFYIFTDCLEICRKKKKVAATTKEGTIISDKMMKLMHGQPFKHVVLIKFSAIRAIDNIVSDSHDVSEDIFGLTLREDDELIERHFLFRFIKYANTSLDKMTVLTVLKKIMEQSQAHLNIRPKIITKNAKDIGLNLSHLPHGMNPLTNFAYKTKVFFENAFKGNDNSSAGVNQQQHGVSTCSSFQRSMSLDNILIEMQRKQEDTCMLQTASFPVGKR